MNNLALAEEVQMEPEEKNELGEYLLKVRKAKGYDTLRAVEDATGKEISNAYLSQLENGRIKKPSPNILHTLAELYGVSYAALMQMAGYIVERNRSDSEKHGSAVTFAIANLTKDEEEELLKYLGYIRTKYSDR